MVHTVCLSHPLNTYQCILKHLRSFWAMSRNEIVLTSDCWEKFDYYYYFFFLRKRRFCVIVCTIYIERSLWLGYFLPLSANEVLFRVSSLNGAKSFVRDLHDPDGDVWNLLDSYRSYIFILSIGYWITFLLHFLLTRCEESLSCPLRRMQDRIRCPRWGCQTIPRYNIHANNNHVGVPEKSLSQLDSCAHDLISRVLRLFSETTCGAGPETRSYVYSACLRYPDSLKFF